MNKSSCNPEDPCKFSPIIKKKSMACDGEITRVEVEAWTVGVATRQIELQGNNISNTSKVRIGLFTRARNYNASLKLSKT